MLDDVNEHEAAQRDGTAKWASRVFLGAERGERGPLLVSALANFLILCGYYIARPVRDEIASEQGSEVTSMLWTAVFFVMLGLIPLYTWATTVLPRRVFIPGVYVAVGAITAVFGGLMSAMDGPALIWTERAFYVWVSCFNLLVVSVFWSVMADRFRSRQSERLFGPIFAGGSLGGIAGPLIVKQFIAWDAERLGLLAISGGVIVGAGAILMWLAWRRSAAARQRETDSARAAAAQEDVVRGSVWSGFRAVLASPYLLAICGTLAIYSLGSTFLYFTKTELIGDLLADRSARRDLLATIDLAVNAATLLAQWFLVRSIAARMGLTPMLIVRPIVTMLGFAALATAIWRATGNSGAGDESRAMTVVWVIVGFETTRRAVNYAFARPSREMLFTLVTREQKYRSKAFIDTIVYRGSDMASSWLFNGLAVALAGAMAAVWVTASVIPAAMGGVGLGWWLARRFELRQAAEGGEEALPPVAAHEAAAR